MIKKHILILSLMIFSYGANAGGGWVHKKGKGFFKLSEWWVIADQHYTSNGIDPNITTGLFNTSLYGEYGISDKVDLMANLNLFSRTYINAEISGTTGEIINPGDEFNSLGDSDIGFKYGLVRDKPVVVSALLMLGIPLGKTNQGNRGTLATGDGEFNQYMSLQASTSKSFGKLNSFYSLNFGFNNRTKGFSDELRYGLEVGGIYNKKLLAIIRIQVLKSLKNGNFTDSSGGASIFATDTEFSSFTYEVAYEFKEKFGVTANVGGAFSGKLIFANKSYSAGVYFKL